MDKQLKKIYLYIGIFVAIIFIGATYAFFTAGMSSETSTTVRADAGTMKITYSGGSNINLAGIYPKDDVWATKTITVTGNNTTDAQMYYKLTLVVDSNTFKTDDPLQYELVSTNTSTNGEIIPNISKTDFTKTSIELGSGHFVKANNAKHTYLLKIYYPKKTTSQNANQGATFSAHVEITSAKAPAGPVFADTILANNEVKTPLTTPGDDVSAHTLNDSSIRTNKVSTSDQAKYITYGTGYTVNGKIFQLTGVSVTSDTYANSYSSLVGKYLSYDTLGFEGSDTANTIVNPAEPRTLTYYVVSTTPTSFSFKVISSPENVTEAVLASTEDDYGTSYYFRGAVKNNYVQFANKCWRIVRIAGNNSVKLILHNDNTSGATNPCSAANHSEDAAFAHYRGTTYNSYFNYAHNDNAYVGFMYGEAGASDYESTHANINKSDILTNLETWYANSLNSYDSKIADTVWCADKSVTTEKAYYSSGTTVSLDRLGYGTNETYYGSYERLRNKSPYAYSGGTGPSLKCSNALSKITGKIGLISADELAFAGYATYDVNNVSVYLQENATAEYWWTLTPGYYKGNNFIMWFISGKYGMLWRENGGTTKMGMRPTISLKATVNNSGGSGTSEDPYIID
ncbi:MAG: hypothetical protein Q4C33_02020 [bacterium]|nr:hypothetical protein [bacterium]